MVDRVVPIQFNESLLGVIEEYVNSGLYSSKADFVRAAVRQLIIELRKELFFGKVDELKKLTKKIKLNSPLLSKELKDEVFEKL